MTVHQAEVSLDFDFSFGVPLDAQLFSMEVPPGYTLKQADNDLEPDLQSGIRKETQPCTCGTEGALGAVFRFRKHEHVSATFHLNKVEGRP
jgi:hypothetical protein